MSQRLHRRTYPHGERELCALDQDWWTDSGLDISQRVAVIWPNTANSPTLVGYYDTVSEANTAAAGEELGGGGRPIVLVNWAHPDIGKVAVGPVMHQDATQDLPDWYDEDPAS